MTLDPRTFLRAHHGRDVGPVAFLGAGEWSRCFGYSLDGRELAVRFGRHREDFEKDRRAAAWRSPALPVPEVLEIGPAGDGEGAWFAVSERAHGEPLEEVGPGAFAALAPALRRAFEALRSIDLSGARGWGPWGSDGSAPFASWADYLRSVGEDGPGTRTPGWRARLAASVVGIGPFDAGLATLGELAEGLDVERGVVHGDLLNRNVLVGPGRIEAVLDWGCALYGDPLYEVALFRFWAPWHPTLSGADLAADARARAGPDADERLRACLLHIGLAHQAYTAWFGREDDLVRIAARTAALL